MKKFISIFICVLMFSAVAYAKKKPSKKSSKKEIKKVEKKVEPDLTEFEIVEDQSKYEEYVEEAKHCNIVRGIHMRFLVRGPHKTFFFLCSSLEPIKKTKTQYTPNIEDPYTIHWITQKKKRYHFDEMGGFGGEKSEIEVFKDKILIHVSIPWGDKVAPLYTREISCDQKTCVSNKFTCDIKPQSEDLKLLPEFNRFLDTIAEPKNRKSETWDDVWGIYMGKVLFQALSGIPSSIDFLAKYPQKSEYPSDGNFAETLMALKDDLELARKAGCVK